MMSRLSLKAATRVFSTAIWAFAPVQSFMALLLHDSFQPEADVHIRLRTFSAADAKL